MNKISSKIALAHDWVVGMRGGERVLDRLARLYGPTELYTLVANGRPHTEAIDACSIRTSPLQNFPGARGPLRRFYLPLMPWAISQLQVQPCALLISTSSAVMKAIRPPENVPHLCYCHSPARYFWGQTKDYAQGSGKYLRSWGLRAARSWFQAWDRKTAATVTRFLANSQHTAARIQRAYGREAEVVYPPVRTSFFTPTSHLERENGYLVVAALEPYKNTEMVVEFSNRYNVPLKIAGSGTQLARLKALAGPQVKFLGHVNDEDLLDLYRRARALIFAQAEDFGIIAVEAQATGCPVIAFTGGGALETVTTNTGIFF